MELLALNEVTGGDLEGTSIWGMRDNPHSSIPITRTVMEAELIELCIGSCYTYDVYIYIWAKRDILLALGLNMKYSTLKRVTQEYYTQFSWQWYDKLALFWFLGLFWTFWLFWDFSWPGAEFFVLRGWKWLQGRTYQKIMENF